tara:strand:- start:454 stop:1020 length:567 start_codon:yes stop_codon:yes gene_type:complete
MSDEIINKPKFNLNEFFNKNKKSLVVTAITIILLLFAFIITNEYKKQKYIEISKNYNSAKIFIEKNKTNEALKILEEIIFKNNRFYSPSALNLIIDNKLIKDKKKILSYFDEIISNSKLDIETKNLFIFKKTVFIGDDIEENELLSSLKPILKSDSLWKDTASDYIKKYYLSKGEFIKAKEFENIINE